MSIRPVMRIPELLPRLLPSASARRTRIKAGLNFLSIRWTDIARHHLVLGTLAAYVAFGFAGYLFVEVWPIRVFVELMPFRTVVMAVPFMLAVIASFAAGELRAKRYFIFAGLAVAFLLASPYGRRLGVPLPVPGLLLLGIVALGLLIEAKAWRIAPGILQAGLSPMRLGASALVLLILLAGPAAIARRSAFVIPTRDNQHSLYAWAFENTPRDARFLVEQFSSRSAYSHAISPQKMRLVGQRAVIGSRDFPFLDRDIQAWAWTWLLVLDNGASDRVERADVSTLLSINEAFPFDYVVRRTPLLPSSAFESVVAFGPVKGVDRLLVYRVSR